jgi:hypothetical protein
MALPFAGEEFVLERKNKNGRQKVGGVEGRIKMGHGRPICEVLGSEVEQYWPSWPRRKLQLPKFGGGKRGKMSFKDKLVTILKVGFLF